MTSEPILNPTNFGKELILDLYDCNPETIRSKELLENYAKELCRVIEMKPFGDIFSERFGLNDEKIAGYSIVQLIETSSITGHFSELKNSAYINIFSCKDFDAELATKFSTDYFSAGSHVMAIHIRD